MSDWDRKQKTRRDRIKQTNSPFFNKKPARKQSPVVEDPNAPVRLSKRMSELGICSRREADEWIEKGWVLVDGEVVNQLGTKVLRTQRVTIKKEASREQGKKVTIILNKPLGYVSGQAEDGYKPAKVLVRRENFWDGDESHQKFSPEQLQHLVPAGRLDINSTGLLILTQDGRIAKEIIGNDSSLEKEYLVRVRMADGSPNKDFPESKLRLLNHGLSLDGQPLLPAKVSWINDNQMQFILKEGKNRQIRRMCDLVGLKVLALKRVRIGNIRLGKLPIGKWRYLSSKENISPKATNKS